MIKWRSKLKWYDKNWLGCTYFHCFMFIVRPFRCEAWRSFSFFISNFIFGPILRPDGNFCGLSVTSWFCGLFGLKMVVWSHFLRKSAIYIKIFGYFFFFPKSKTPNFNLEVSSINGYAVNIRQLGSYIVDWILAVLKNG